MGTSSFSWGQRALTKGSNPRPSLVPFTERAAASMKWKQAAWELPQSVAEVLLPLLGLSIYFGQIVRNIRCIVQGHILEREIERALEMITEKGLEVIPALWISLIMLYLLPVTFTEFPPGTCRLPAVFTVHPQWEDSHSSQVTSAVLFWPKGLGNQEPYPMKLWLPSISSKM